MITAGSNLNSLTQISRALKSGFAVKADLIYDDALEPQPWFVQRDVIRKMTDLHESAYKQLLGIDDYECGPCDPFTMYYSWWQFVAVKL